METAPPEPGDLTIAVSPQEQGKIRVLAEQSGMPRAIQYAQALTGTSLDQARQVVDRIVAGARQSPTPSAAEDALSLGARARQVRETQGPAAAIRLVQHESGASLARSKAFVDGLD